MTNKLLGATIATLSVLAFANEASATHASGPYSVDVLVNGMPTPIYESGGQSYVAGAYGASYQIRVHNGSGQRIEAVVAVDGRDVVTGQPVDPRRHRGYIINPYGTSSITGFRSSAASVATFRFSTIPRSYAWRTGTAWGIGTIRVWIFEENVPRPIARPVLPYGGGARRAPGAAGGYYGGDAAAESAPSAAARDMGTEYGEQRWDPVSYTSFLRRSSRASTILGVRYQSQEALMSAGIIGPYYPTAPVYSPVYYPVCSYPGCPPYGGYAAPPPGYPY